MPDYKLINDQLHVLGAGDQDCQRWDRVMDLVEFAERKDAELERLKAKVDQLHEANENMAVTISRVRRALDPHQELPHE